MFHAYLGGILILYVIRELWDESGLIYPTVFTPTRGFLNPMDINLYMISSLPLKRPVKVDVHHSGGLYFAANKDLEIFIGDATIACALRHFCEFFVDDYKNFTKLVDKYCHDSISELISKYREYIIDD